MLSKRLLLIALLLVAPLPRAHSQGDGSQSETHGHTFEDLLDAVLTLRKKTNPMAFFNLYASQLPISPQFHPDGKGEAYCVVLIGKVFSKTPLSKEMGEELALRKSARFTPTYDRKRRRLAYYPPETIADCAAVWLHGWYWHPPTRPFGVRFRTLSS